MSKKSKKSATAAAPAQGESFFNEGAAANGAASTPVQAAAATAESTKAKRSYKPRAGKAAGKVTKSAIAAAYDLGYKHALARMEMGA